MATPIEIRPTVLPNEQRLMGAPVVHAPGLPAMEKVGEVRSVLRNTALPLMTPEAASEPRGEHLMAKAGGMSEVPPSHGLGPQRPKESQNMPTPVDGYVRLEVHFENGRLSVIGAKDVPGPLAIPTAVIQGHVYEVLIGDQQIAVGSLPDVGIRRAFANRDVPDPENKHRFIQTPAFDFFVRIPRARVTTETLPKMDIILHNVREAPDRLASAVPMEKQTDVEVVEVARLSGVKLESMPVEVRSQLEGIIGENKIAH
jgi:hypothetical protein